MAKRPTPTPAETPNPWAGVPLARRPDKPELGRRWRQRFPSRR